MSQQTDQLIQLIQTLTKAEKKSFRIYANRNSNSGDMLYMQLFDYIDSAKNYSEAALLKKIPQIKKIQLSNIKANLTKQILANLRLLHKNDNIDMHIREMLDYTEILQSKGMTNAALDMLDKARKLAKSHQKALLRYEILDTERKIETQYITGSSAKKAVEINQNSEKLLKKVHLLDKLSNLSLMIYGMYLKFGYVRNERDFEQVRDFFFNNLPDIKLDRLGHYEKIYYFQSNVWYYHITQDFVNYYKYSQKWVDIFRANPYLIKDDPILYLKGLHNALNALYMANKRDKFQQYFSLYCDHETTIIGEKMSVSHLASYFLFKYVHLLNGIFLTGNYQQGVQDITTLTKTLENNLYQWDTNRVMVFYYKIACVYFGDDEYDQALTYLNKINHSPIGGLREDIQCFARILSLISHYELGNEFHLRYQIKSVYRFLIKMEELQAVQKEILNFIRHTPEMNRKDIMQEFIKIRAKLIKYQSDPYERRPFLYLDIIAWLDSKIEKKRIQDVIQSNIRGLE